MKLYVNIDLIVFWWTKRGCALTGVRINTCCPECL